MVNEIVDELVGPEAEEGEGTAAAEEVLAETEETKPEGEELPAKAEELADVDIEAELAKTTAPGGAPAGVIHDLQEERRARQEAVKEANDLRMRLAVAETVRAQRTEAQPLIYSIEDAIDKEMISPDDPVSAGLQALINRNCRDRDETTKKNEETTRNRETQAITDIAAQQRQQLTETLSPAKVGVDRSFDRMIARGMAEFSPQEKRQLQTDVVQAIHNGENAASLAYTRCRDKLCTVYPELKTRFIGKSTIKPGASGTKPTKPEKANESGELTQEKILKTPDEKAVEDMFLR